MGGEVYIGGQRDEYGCLGSAGYSWSEEAGACLRAWEIQDDNQLRAVKIAVEHVASDTFATVIEVVSARCTGCFVIKLELGEGRERRTVNIESWEVKEMLLTPEECEALGGTTLNTVGGSECAEGEENIGEVTGFISPNICCAPIK